MAWADKIKARLHEQDLIDLTNYSGATAIDDDRLGAAIDDVLGEFHINTGFDPDETDRLHVAAVTTGIRYKLEEYKGRDGGLIDGYRKQFFSSCNGIRKRIHILPVAVDNTSPTRRDEDATPDMDRTKPAFTGGVRGGFYRVQEFSGE